jgi:hypothetical protein
MNREVCRRFALLAEPETGGCRRVARAAMGAADVIHVIYVPALMLLHLAALYLLMCPRPRPGGRLRAEPRRRD